MDIGKGFIKDEDIFGQQSFFKLNNVLACTDLNLGQVIISLALPKLKLLQ
jgi:hypothetical protein